MIRVATMFWLVVVLGACGAPASSGPLSAPPILFADAVLDVHGGSEAELCVSASIPSLSVEFPQECFAPPFALALLEAGSAPYGPSTRPIGTVTLFVSAHPVTVSGVHQDGQPVPWWQAGGGLLIAGGPTLNLETAIDFEISERPGSCHFGPAGQGCTYSP